MGRGEGDRKSFKVNSRVPIRDALVNPRAIQYVNYWYILFELYGGGITLTVQHDFTAKLITYNVIQRSLFCTLSYVASVYTDVYVHSFDTCVRRCIVTRIHPLVHIQLTVVLLSSLASSPYVPSSSFGNITGFPLRDHHAATR